MKRMMIVAALVLPVLLVGFSGGPPTGSAGVQGELTCARAGCHAGAAVGTQMAITTTSANYRPGVAQPITVQITDTFNLYGFQATARFASDAKAQAGFFRSTGGNYLIQCASRDLTFEAEKTGTACPSERPLEYIMQSRSSNVSTFTFEWTPPADATGDIILYAAGNAANGNGQNTGDRIHTAQLRLTPAAAAPRPSISAGGIVQAQAFGGGARISPGSWIEIFGTNLATTTREWAGGDFTGMNAPTSLENVDVTIGGRPAFVRFVSPGQVNVQVPDIGSGQSTVSIRNANGTSDNFTITSVATNPGWLAPPAFRVGDRQYIAALFPDSTGSGPFVGRPGLIAGLNLRTARPGDTIILYGVGFGAVTPATPPGRIAPASTALNAFALRFGDQAVTTSYAGLAPGAVGLYQINAVIPANLPAGEYQIQGTVNGANLPSGIFINLQ